MPLADADKRREYDADYKRKARAAEPCPTRLSLPVEFRAKTAADVLGLLNEQLDTLRQDASLGSVERAKSVGYLAGIMLRAIEAGDTVAWLEAILKSRMTSNAAAEPDELANGGLLKFTQNGLRLGVGGINANQNRSNFIRHRHLQIRKKEIGISICRQPGLARALPSIRPSTATTLSTIFQ